MAVVETTDDLTYSKNHSFFVFRLIITSVGQGFKTGELWDGILTIGAGTSKVKNENLIFITSNKRMLGTPKEPASGDGGSPHCEGPIDPFYGWTQSRQFVDVIIELIPRWYRAVEHPCRRRGALLLFYG